MNFDYSITFIAQTFAMLVMNEIECLDGDLQTRIVRNALRSSSIEVLNDLSLAVESLDVKYENLQMKKFLALLCRSGNQSCLIWCINNGLDINMKINSESDTLLHIAIGAREGALVLVLVACGADLLFRNSVG